jgi:prepilin-type N-terminal cleavage/methylation domain-containing protein
LETGNKLRAGFSLVELLIVIALVALIGSLIVASGDAILRGLGAEPVETTFRKAVREARFQAAYRREDILLTFDREKAAFLLVTESAATIATFPTDEDSEGGEIDVIFSRRLPAEGLSSLDNPETEPIPSLTFRPDRSSTPFVVEFDLGPVNFEQHFDPFSDVVIEDSRQP